MSPYRKVIIAIHEKHNSGMPFAIWQLRDEAKVSTNSVTRVLQQLVRVKLVSHQRKGFAGRRYKTTKIWPLNVKEAMETYEYAKALGI